MSKLLFRFNVLSSTAAPDTSSVVANLVAPAIWAELATSRVLSKSTAPETPNVPNV